MRFDKQQTVSQTRRSRGYCFVYFESLKCAVRAVESSSALRIDARYVRVDYSITNRPRSPPPDRVRDGCCREFRYRSHRVRSPSPRHRKHFHWIFFLQIILNFDFGFRFRFRFIR